MNSRSHHHRSRTEFSGVASKPSSNILLNRSPVSVYNFPLLLETDSNQHERLIQFPSELPELLGDLSLPDSSGSLSSVSYEENSFEYGQQQQDDDDEDYEEEEPEMDYRTTWREEKRSIFQNYWEKTGQEPLNLKQTSSRCCASSIRSMPDILRSPLLHMEQKSKSDPSIMPNETHSPVSILRKRGDAKDSETKRRDSNVSFDAKVNVIVFEKEYWVTKGWSKFFSI